MHSLVRKEAAFQIQLEADARAICSGLLDSGLELSLKQASYSQAIPLGIQDSIFTTVTASQAKDLGAESIGLQLATG